MAAYYCEAGRIEGAVKKGKTWFIPADAPKPLDKRYSRDTIKAKESQAVGDILVDIAESAVYHMKDIFEHLGFTRETLRSFLFLQRPLSFRPHNNKQPSGWTLSIYLQSLQQ